MKHIHPIIMADSSADAVPKTEKELPYSKGDPGQCCSGEDGGCCCSGMQWGFGLTILALISASSVFSGNDATAVTVVVYVVGWVFLLYSLYISPKVSVYNVRRQCCCTTCKCNCVSSGIFFIAGGVALVLFGAVSMTSVTYSVNASGVFMILVGVVSMITGIIGIVMKDTYDSDGLLSSLSIAEKEMIKLEVKGLKPSTSKGSINVPGMRESANNSMFAEAFRDVAYHSV